MNERLNVLEENKKIILQKVKDIDKKKLSKKWILLYGAGCIGMMTATTILFYPENMMLALLLTTVYIAGMPALQTTINNKKKEKLRKEYSSIKSEIEEIKKEMIEQLLTDDVLTKDIPITSYKQLKAIEEKIIADLEPSEQDRYLKEIDTFFFGEEYDETSEDVLNEFLSDDKKKGYTRKRKR